MTDSRVLDFVNTVSLLCPFLCAFIFMSFCDWSTWFHIYPTHCARYAMSSTEGLILRSSLLRLLAFIRWKVWRPGNNMPDKLMNYLTRRATDQLWLKNLHRYSLIFGLLFWLPVNNKNCRLWCHLSFRNSDLALQFHFMLFSKIGSNILMENSVSLDS